MDYRSLPLTLTDVLSLQRIGFQNRGQLPVGSGIYFVLYGDPPGRIAYIGKAKNVQRRWIGHHRIPEFTLLSKLFIPVDIAWVSVPVDDLDETEAFLISTFGPPLNDGLTLDVAKSRMLPSVGPSQSPEGILEEFRARRENAIDLLVTEEFWNVCNDDDGDLLCVWPYVDDAVMVEFDMLWAQNDNHDTQPSRVIMPPLIRANDSGIVAPNREYEASWTERLDWTLQVARQVDSFLMAIVCSHIAALDEEARRQVLSLIAREPGVERSIRENPERLARGE